MIIRFILISLALFSSQLMAELPERIVTGDGSLTEIIYALDSQDKLAGVDTTSVYPLSARQLPQVGYKRNLSVEGILSLYPDVLLVTEDSGPIQNLNQLQQVGLEVRTFSAAANLDAVKEKILGVANIVGKPQAGEALWQQVKTKVDAATEKAQSITQPLKVMFLLSSGEKSPVVAGNNTHADSIIRMAGGVNAVKGIQGYKSISDEAIIIANPDVILMMKRTNMTPATLFSRPGFKFTNAAKKQRLIAMDGMYMLGFGPRIGDAIEDLSEQLYP